MATLEDFIGQLFALKPGAQGPGLPARAAPAPVAAPAPSAMLDSSPQGKLLAELLARSNAKPAAGSGLFGNMPAGPLPNVKGQSKWGALAAGVNQGMNDTQNAQAAAATAEAARAAQNLKTMSALFDISGKEADRAQKAKSGDALAKYYEGMVANGKAAADAKAGKGGSMADGLNLSSARRNNMATSGVNDPELAKQLRSPIPAEAQAAQLEYARRKRIYDDLDAQTLKAANMDPLVPQQGDALDAQTLLNDPTAVATPPAHVPDPAATQAASKSAATPKGTAAPVTAPVTWKVIKGPGGQLMKWSPETGETMPVDADPAAAALPDSSPAGD